MHSIRTRAIGAALMVLPMLSFASSHREAPLIGGTPRVDGTDVYAFRSYEPGRAQFVTLIANYIPFQDPQGGPNFYPLDTDAIYVIDVFNTGDAVSRTSFQFRFNNENKGLTVPAGGRNVAVPLINIGPVDASGKTLNTQQNYTVTVRKGGMNQLAENVSLGGTRFYKPADNIGVKSIPDYASYANSFIYDISIPGCPTPGRVFVGQRKEGFVVNVGEIFDLVNTNPVGPRDGVANDLSHKNITSLALEVPISCLTTAKDPVIGVVSSVLKRSGDTYTQVSRLGNPLVNEAVIGLPDKDKFNASYPQNDAAFLTYVTNPTLPVLLNALFGDAAKAPQTPRNDLVATFLTGIKGLNQPLKVTPAEMLRLNTSIPPTAPAAQNDLGVLGNDLAGFPNGRRPYDDVTDIELRALEGALCGKAGSCGSQTSDPNNGTPYTDGARAAGADAGHLHVSGKVDPADTYLDSFPYLNTPLPGSGGTGD
jgi:Domain of unknown function (DUF4331)